MSAPPGIFKAYDIRGIYGDEIDGDLAEEIGRAFTRVIGELSGKETADLGIGLGHDMRLPAGELSERYRQGIMAEGAHVIDIGEVGTEMLYWLVGSRELDGGLMCTASHNPKAYTGAKLVKEGAIALSGDSGIKEIQRLVEDGLGPAQVCDDGLDPEALVGQAFGSPDQLLLPAARDRQVIAEITEAVGDRVPDPAGSASDECRALGQGPSVLDYRAVQPRSVGPTGLSSRSRFH